LGSINSSGINPLILLLGLALGGEGLVEYSVKESVFRLGVLGLDPLVSPLPLTAPFSTAAIVAIAQLKILSIMWRKSKFVDSKYILVGSSLVCAANGATDRGVNPPFTSRINLLNYLTTSVPKELSSPLLFSSSHEHPILSQSPAKMSNTPLPSSFDGDT
jgi:hypothetical protein